MMGRLERDQGQLFYSFCLEEVVPDDHQVRADCICARSVVGLWRAFAPLSGARPPLDRSSSNDPDADSWLRLGLWSERLLCREVRVYLGYRWFCDLSIEDKIPDHSVSASPQ